MAGIIWKIFGYAKMFWPHKFYNCVSFKNYNMYVSTKYIFLGSLGPLGEVALLKSCDIIKAKVDKKFTREAAPF